MYQVTVTYQIPSETKPNVSVRDYILLQMEQPSLKAVRDAVMKHKPFASSSDTLEPLFGEENEEPPFVRVRDFLLRNLQQQYQAYHDAIDIGNGGRLEALHGVAFYVTSAAITSVANAAYGRDMTFKNMPRQSSDDTSWPTNLWPDGEDEEDEAPARATPKPAMRAKTVGRRRGFVYSSDDAFLEFAVQKLPEHVAFVRV